MSQMAHTNGNGNNGRNIVSVKYSIIIFGEGTVKMAKKFYGREDAQPYFQIKLSGNAGGASLFINEPTLVDWAASLNGDSFEQEWNAAQLPLMVEKKQAMSREGHPYNYYTL